MGNTTDKTHGGRGQALGSSTDPPKKPTSKSKKKSRSKSKKQPHQHPIYHSQEEQRAARSKLVQKKQINVQSELNKKEKMLHIVESADAVSQGQKPPNAPQHMQYDTNNKSDNKSPKTSKNNTNKSQSSIYMANPSSKEALAAEKRIQQKQSKKIKNSEERKNRTRDLLFGDALKLKDDEIMEYNTGNNNEKTDKKKAQFYKSDRDVPLSSNSKTANAALARLDKQKNNRIVNQKDRKKRTIQLMHGDLLKTEDEVKAAPRQSTYHDDMDPDIVDVHQSILNLNNCNAHEKMPGTAKLLRKVVTNLLSAETIEDQEKFGKLRLSNKKIKAAFVDMEYGVETLQAIGFTKKKIYNDKEHKMDDYMIFDFSNLNQKGLIHVMDLLNEYYPEQ